MLAATLTLLSLLGAEPRVRVLLDAGHGAPGNNGARTARCEEEAEVMLELTADLARRLPALGPFEVHQTRRGREAPSYEARRTQADRVRADVVLSMHLDTRGSAEWVTTSSGAWCLRTEEHQGIAVLYADRGGDARLHERRRLLARSLVSRFAEEGLPIYGGEDYEGLYDFDPLNGAFIDRRGLFFLRRFRQPTVIIETQQGLSLQDRARWDDEQTRARFARAVARALLDVSRSPASSGGR